MTTLENFRRFVAEYPRHKFQPGALQAYEAALAEVSPSDLQHATRRFAAEVRAARPGRNWKYCPGPRKWLVERRYLAYVTPEENHE